MNVILRLAPLMLTVMSAMAQPVRVGTFHKPSLVLAFYRSPAWSQTVKAKIAEREQAAKNNDAARVAELEKWGSTQQELAHQQLAGNAPIANILEALAPSLAGVAGKAAVSLIAADVAWSGPAVERVDVTDLLLDILQADERTRSMARDLRSRPGPPDIH
jgi:hypothetical protein